MSCWCWRWSAQLDRGDTHLSAAAGQMTSGHSSPICTLYCQYVLLSTVILVPALPVFHDNSSWQRLWSRDLQGVRWLIPLLSFAIVIMSQPTTSEVFYKMGKQTDVAATYTLSLDTHSRDQWFVLNVYGRPDQHAFVQLSLLKEPSTTSGSVKYVLWHFKGEPGRRVGVSFVECDSSDNEFQPTIVSKPLWFYDTTTYTQQDTPMIAGGEYDYDQDENQISLVEGVDIGTYVMKIMPDMRHQVFDISTLRLDVKTYYCNAQGTPRAKFLEEFPHDAYERHRHRLFMKCISDFIYVRSHCQFIYDPLTPEYYDSDV